MHPSPTFRVEDEAVLLAHLAARPFVTLAAVVEGRPVVAHAPLVVRRLPGGLALDFHLSRGNALAPALATGFRAVAVSLGPEAYVSPDWYEDRDQVPTWNYLSVEAEGPVVALDEAGLVGLLDELAGREGTPPLAQPPRARAQKAPRQVGEETRGVISAPNNGEAP